MKYPHIKIEFINLLTKYYYEVMSYQTTEYLFLIDYMYKDKIIKDSLPLSEIKNVILTKRIYGQRKEDQNE